MVWDAHTFENHWFWVENVRKPKENIGFTTLKCLETLKSLKTLK